MINSFYLALFVRIFFFTENVFLLSYNLFQIYNLQHEDADASLFLLS